MATQRKAKIAETKIETPKKPLVDAVHDLFEEYKDELPSWKRNVAAFALSMAACAGTGYVISTITAYAIAGIAVFNGSMFLTFFVFALALLVSVYAGLKLSEKVTNYVMSGQIDRDIVAAKNKVLGWFGKRNEVVA